MKPIDKPLRKELRRRLLCSFKEASWGDDYGMPKQLLISETWPLGPSEPYNFRLYIWESRDDMLRIVKSIGEGAFASCGTRLTQLQNCEKKKVMHAANIEPHLIELHFALDWLTPPLIAHEAFHAVCSLWRVKNHPYKLNLERDEEQFATAVQYITEHIWGAAEWLLGEVKKCKAEPKKPARRKKK